MKWSEIPPYAFEDYKKYVAERWKHLSNITDERFREALKLLFLTNAGGAVAMLTFLGTTATVRAEDWTWALLKLFCSGIALLIVFHLLTAAKTSRLFQKFRHDVAELYADRLEWKKLIDGDSRRSDEWKVLLLLPIASLICLLAAMIIGGSNYSSLINKERENGRKETADSIHSNKDDARPGIAEKQPSVITATVSSNAKGANSEEIKKPAH